MATTTGDRDELRGQSRPGPHHPVLYDLGARDLQKDNGRAVLQSQIETR